MLKDSALLVKHTKRAWNPVVKDANAAKEVDNHFNSTQAGNFYKRLMKDCPEFNVVNSHLNDAYLWHVSRTLPWLDRGQRIIASTMIDEYIKHMNTAKSKLHSLLDALEPVYNAAVQSDCGRLAGLANNDDYPAFDLLRGKFGIDIKFFPVPDSNDFRVQVSQDIKDELDKVVADSAILGKNELKERVSEAVTRIYDQCSKEKGRLFESMLTNAAELADVMSIMNVHNDSDVTRWAQGLKELTEATTILNLRNSDYQRMQLAEKAKEFLDSLNGVIATAQQVVVQEVPQEISELADSVI